MIKVNNFQQSRMIERIDEILHPKNKIRLDESWPGVFRNSFLQMMPLEDFSKGFSYDMGRPTKEHYSVCGLLLLKDYFGWTTREAVDQYLYNLKIHYALMIEPDNLELSTRTLERYLKIFRKNELAQKLMDTVTRKIIGELNIKIDKQRLDSSHVFSNMAEWGRSMLLFKTTKRFLIQVKRHESKVYHELDAELRKLYEAPGNWIYEAKNRVRNVRYGKHVCSNKEQIGWDMLRLIEQFENHPKLSGINTFKDMVRVFYEQCKIDDGKVKIRKHPGGGALINPSDPDASVDNKGVGYQVQVSQTCNPDNPVQIITAALPQGASESDQNAIDPMLKKMEENNAKPEQVLADSGYGSDENVVNAAKKDVELLAPTTGKKKGKIGLEECEFDNENRIVKCPCGKKPIQKRFIAQKGRAVFAGETCKNCPKLKQCISSKQGNNYLITYETKSLRLRDRRHHEKTDEFRDSYRPRGGIEALFGSLKQNTPLRRLNIRGKEAVYNAIYSIITMHNIMQMAKFIENQSKKVPEKFTDGIKSASPYIFFIWRGEMCHYTRSMAA